MSVCYLVTYLHENPAWVDDHEKLSVWVSRWDWVMLRFHEWVSKLWWTAYRLPWNRRCTQTHEAWKVTNSPKPLKQGRRLGDGDRVKERDTKIQAHHSFWPIFLIPCSDSSEAISTPHISVSSSLNPLQPIEGGWKQIRKVPRWASSHCSHVVMHWIEPWTWCNVYPRPRPHRSKFRRRIWTSVLDILLDFLRRDLETGDRKF